MTRLHLMENPHKKRPSLTVQLGWRVHTPQLLNELSKVNKDGLGVMTKPMAIFAGLLHQVAERASNINDLELNKLMMRLTLYDIADPESPRYDEKAVDDYMEKTE